MATPASSTLTAPTGSALFFGRNEESGLRCVYHGWKFDVSGACVDLPNAPEGATYKDKVKIKAYPAEDKGDLIWAYMGPAERKPPFPEFEWTKLPRSHRYVTKFIEQCNYLQAMEGDYDPSHARFLHSTLMPAPAISNSATARSRTSSPARGPRAVPRAVGNRRVSGICPHAAAA
jgi:phenylpropionate dioxygenase-like ring-hydroxylating dioxygenase large terminal subunit